MNLILASSSPRRRQLVASLGIPCTVIKPDIDETRRPGEPPLDYVRRLSREKAATVAASQLPAAAGQPPLQVPTAAGQGSRSLLSGVGIILAADTVVILGADTLGIDEHGDILGKPVDAADARDMLRRLRGRTHQVCTAITLQALTGPSQTPADLVFSPLTGKGAGDGVFTRLTTTHVTMRDYTDAEIDAYIATGDPFDKAGSYAIQHPIFRPVARLDGCYTNVVGLPLCTLKTLLADIGWPGIAAVDGCDCPAP